MPSQEKHCDMPKHNGSRANWTIGPPFWGCRSIVVKQIYVLIPVCGKQLPPAAVSNACRVTAAIRSAAYVQRAENVQDLQGPTTPRSSKSGILPAHRLSAVHNDNLILARLYCMSRLKYENHSEAHHTIPNKFKSRGFRA
eukprot:scaffold198781_cov44-Prasinocladus_malaysianus.AAC.1